MGRGRKRVQRIFDFIGVGYEQGYLQTKATEAANIAAAQPSSSYSPPTYASPSGLCVAELKWAGLLVHLIIDPIYIPSGQVIMATCVTRVYLRGDPKKPSFPPTVASIGMISITGRHGQAVLII